jgi:hypothetical protein
MFILRNGIDDRYWAGDRLEMDGLTTWSWRVCVTVVVQVKFRGERGRLSGNRERENVEISREATS